MPQRGQAPLTLINSGKYKGKGRDVKKVLHAPHTVLLLSATPIHNLYNPKHEGSDTCASITKPVTTCGCHCSQLLTGLNFL